MKKHNLTYIVLSYVITQLAASPALLGQAAPAPTPAAAITNANGPKIQFAEIAFDFGKVKPTDKPVHEFIFTNIGKALLEITDVRPGCGCTTAGTWDKKVEPGQTGKIPLQFNPANFSGPVTKGATVTCNDPAQGSVYLQFKANIWRPLDVQPQYVYFMPIEGEATNETKVVRIVSNQEEPVTLEAPQSQSMAFKTELKTIRAGKEYELHVTYAGPVSNASPQTTISMKTSSTNMPTVNVTTYAMPQPAIVALPQQIQLPAGPLRADYRYPATIRNNGHTPVKLSDPSVNAAGVTVDMQELEPGKNFRLNLGFPTNFTVHPGQPLELTVKTSHPKHPVIKLPIMQMAAPVAVVGPSSVPAATPAAAAVSPK